MPDSAAASERPVVLVAEDDESVRLAIELMLDDQGFEILFAVDGEEAVAVARKEVPDIILLDAHMPKLDGKEVMVELMNDATTSSIPVLVLSGMARYEPSEWHGAGFVSKPFTQAELAHRVREALAERPA